MRGRDKVGLQQVYEQHTLSVYHTMARRLRLRHLEIPFDLVDFRVWVLDSFGGSWDSAVQCTYCTCWLNVQTFVIDHVEPLKFGGSCGLDNLALCCEECNRRKGALSADGFRKLIEFSVTELHPQDANEIFGRLKDGGAYMRSRVSVWKAKKKLSNHAISMESQEALR